jgi:hypothetical protein
MIQHADGAEAVVDQLRIHPLAAQNDRVEQFAGFLRIAKRRRNLESIGDTARKRSDMLHEVVSLRFPHHDQQDPDYAHLIASLPPSPTRS